MRFLSAVLELSHLRVSAICLLAGAPGLMGFLTWRATLGANPSGSLAKLSGLSFTLMILLIPLLMLVEYARDDSRENRTIARFSSASYLLLGVAWVSFTFGAGPEQLLYLAIVLQFTLGGLMIALTRNLH